MSMPSDSPSNVPHLSPASPLDPARHAPQQKRRARPQPGDMPGSDFVTHLVPERGRLMNAAQIATSIFSDAVSTQWVRRNVAPAKKLRLGHSTVLWWERDVIEWLDGQRGPA